MNLSTLHRLYNTQDKCLAYLEKVRWGKSSNVSCPRCMSKSVVRRGKS